MDNKTNNKSMKNKDNKTKIRVFVSLFISLIVAPIVVILGIFVWKNSNFAVLSVGVAVIALVGFFAVLEKKESSTREIVVISIMVALSVVSRLIFVAVPSFKPITAMIIITGIAFGAQSGFLCGAFSALISNIYFGQGPWTPLQMLAWGLIGLFSGIIFYRKEVKKVNMIILLIFGAISGVIFSLFMDIWTVFSIDKAFSWSRYIFFVSASLPIMAIYSVSNVVFLAILTIPMTKQTNRIRIKYNIFNG